MPNLGTLLRDSVGKYGPSTAIIDGDVRLTYAELDGRVRGFARSLVEVGFRPGQRVGIMVPNSHAFTVAYYGTLYAGGIVVALGTLMSGDELEYQLNDSQADVMVLSEHVLEAGLFGYQRAPNCKRLVFIGGQTDSERPGGAELLESLCESGSPLETLVEIDDSETAVIMYTSGTTGRPKGAELAHSSLYRNAEYSYQHLHGPGQTKHVALAALPLYHSFGQTVVQNSVLMGGGVFTCIRQFAADKATEIIFRDKVTSLVCVPTMFIDFLNEPTATRERLASVISCTSGGAPLPVEVKHDWHKKYGLWIREGYGLTETSPIAAFQSQEEASKAGAVGKPIEGVEFQIVDADDQPLPAGERGELCIRGYNILKCYCNKPEASGEALRGGWFHSGDVAYVDEVGDYHIVDRTKDMILRGGFNVYPRELEEVLYAHPLVREAAVVGVPHDRLGEEVKAVVALMEGATASSEDIKQYCKEHLAAYKYPRIVEIRDELPKGPTGKVLKRELREQAAGPSVP